MASYTKTIYSHSSENDGSLKIWSDAYNFFAIQKKSNTLYVSSQKAYSTNTYWYNDTDMYFNLDSIPMGKTITSVTVYIYCQKVYSDYISMGGTDFKINAGWNSVQYNSWNGVHVGGVYNLNMSPVDTQNMIPQYPGRWAEIDSHLTSNKPYVVVTYKDTPPDKPRYLFPYKANIDARAPFKFSWVPNMWDSKVKIKHELRYSQGDPFDGPWTTVSSNSPDHSHVFPEGTFTVNRGYWWNVRVQDSNQLWSEWSDVGVFNTPVVPQGTPKIISPSTGYLDGTKKIKLKWQFIGGSDYESQGKYEIKYSADGISWTTIMNDSSLQEHDIPSNTLPTGRIYWKVKTFNSYNEGSDYSDVAMFNVMSSPSLPQIQSVSNKSKPNITWVSTEQTYYGLEIYDSENNLIYEHREPSVEKFHNVKAFIDDGEYRVELVITNEFNLHSKPATLNFIISTIKPPMPIIDVYSGEYSNTIKGDSNTPNTRVYRDNIFIGLLENNIFQDFTCENKKEYKYHLRSIDKEGNFNDSGIKIGICNFRNNTISTAKNPEDFIKLKYGLGVVPGKNTRKSVLGSNFYFDGREYPVVEFSEFKSMEKSLKFFTRDKLDLDKLEELINKKEVLLYRDVEGENIYGTVLSIDKDKEMLGYSFGFTIQKTDYSGDLDD